MCADAPDTSGMNAAAVQSAELADRQQAIAEELLPYYRQRQDRLDALTEAATGVQTGIMRESADQARDYFDYNKATFRPVESSIVAEVMRDTTPEAYARLASAAAARTGATFAATRAAGERSMRSMGVDPSSGRARGVDRVATLSAAAEGSRAFNDAYTQAEGRGYARRLDAAGLGRGLAGASTAAYGVATGAGSAAMGGANQASGTAAGTIGTAGSYFGGAQNSLNGAVNAYGQAANLQMQADASNNALLGSVIGMGTGFGIRKWGG